MPAAAANNDFIPLSNEPFVIPRSATNGETFIFTAQIVGDLVQEGSELFFIDFTTENPNDIIEGSRSRVRILDDGDGECSEKKISSFDRVAISMLIPSFDTVIRDCMALADPVNGQVTVDPDTLQDSIATYTCDVGYDLIGAEMRTCLSSGVWDQTDPTCQSKHCSCY